MAKADRCGGARRGRAAGGDPADLPEPLEFPRADAGEVEALLGRPPDFVVRSTPYHVVANGQDQWWNPELEFEGFDVPRYVRAAEFKPSWPLGIKVTHHGHATLRSAAPVEGGERPPSVRLVGMGIGKRWDLLPEGVGKLLPPGPGTVRFSATTTTGRSPTSTTTTRSRCCRGARC